MCAAVGTFSGAHPDIVRVALPALRVDNPLAGWPADSVYVRGAVQESGRRRRKSFGPWRLGGNWQASRNVVSGYAVFATSFRCVDVRDGGKTTRALLPAARTACTAATWSASPETSTATSYAFLYAPAIMAAAMLTSVCFSTGRFELAGRPGRVRVDPS